MSTREELLQEAGELRAKSELTEADLARVDEIVDSVAKMDAQAAARKAASDKLAAIAERAPKAAKAVSDVVEVVGKTAGERFVLSPEWQAFKSRFSAGFSSATDQVDLVVRDLVGKADVAHRGTATTGGSAFHLGSPVDDEVRAQYGPLLSAITTGTTDAAVIPYRALTAVTPGPDIKAEAKADNGTGAAGGVFPLATIATRADTATTTTIGEALPVTDEELADDSVMVTLVGEVLMALVMQKIEGEIVSGTATGDRPRGIIGAPGVRTQAKVGTGNDAIFNTLRKALTALGDSAQGAQIVLNPEDLESVDLAADKNGRYLGAGPFGSLNLQLWGHKVIASTAVAKGTAIVGDLKAYELYWREQYVAQVFNQHSDYALRGLSLLRGKSRVIGVFRRRKDVCVATIA
jgi:HK97 family phage major capsid protein|uniref:Major capsid protein n=1 Tax=Siphoviridae sp. ct45W1 TaxID=2823562 RepID=A0A8S5L790_9CAUD|nr:MAG TPA: major capsid protein [Siphoviridae sp. ct45W1]